MPGHLGRTGRQGGQTDLGSDRAQGTRAGSTDRVGRQGTLAGTQGTPRRTAGTGPAVAGRPQGDPEAAAAAQPLENRRRGRLVDRGRRGDRRGQDRGTPGRGSRSGRAEGLRRPVTRQGLAGGSDRCGRGRWQGRTDGGDQPRVDRERPERRRLRPRCSPGGRWRRWRTTRPCRGRWQGPRPHRRGSRSRSRRLPGRPGLNQATALDQRDTTPLQFAQDRLDQVTHLGRTHVDFPA